MIFNGTGLVKNDLYITGFPWSPVYLIATEHPVLFEAGFYCMSRLYEKDIKAVLPDRRPHMLFLSHVHYDHCGATQYLKRVFPGIKVAASRRAAEIVSRPNAQSLMHELSGNMVDLIDNMSGIDKTMILRDPLLIFDIDIILEDGQVIDIHNGLSVHVISAPGHTRDMLSYYIPERKILFATEAAGCLGNSGQIVTEFLVDYDAYISSLKRLSALDVDILCQGHHFVFTGRDVRQHFDRSIRAAEEFKQTVKNLLLSENMSVDRVVSIVKAREYDPNPGPKQPEQAYLINLRTRIAHLAEKFIH